MKPLNKYIADYSIEDLKNSSLLREILKHLNSNKTVKIYLNGKLTIIKKPEITK